MHGRCKTRLSCVASLGNTLCTENASKYFRAAPTLLIRRGGENKIAPSTKWWSAGPRGSVRKKERFI
eukprot:scaffold51397_cov23-Tisochrysis_lutea.AAC.1